MRLCWTPAVATGHPEVDAQHQELYARAAKLLDAILGGDRDEVARLLEFLGAYVVDHFGVEERWMVRARYPGYSSHKAEHDGFIQEYLRHSVELERSGPSALLAMRVNNWLAPWLEAHIAGTDMALVRFLARKSA